MLRSKISFTHLITYWLFDVLTPEHLSANLITKVVTRIKTTHIIFYHLDISLLFTKKKQLNSTQDSYSVIPTYFFMLISTTNCFEHKFMKLYAQNIQFITFHNSIL